MHRDILGRVVREAWVKWALTQPNPKESWLLSYDQIAESDKEADRQIGESIARALDIGPEPSYNAQVAKEEISLPGALRLKHLFCTKGLMYGGDLWCYIHDEPLIERCGMHESLVSE